LARRFEISKQPINSRKKIALIRLAAQQEVA
jgi:hypothetical protein